MPLYDYHCSNCDHYHEAMTPASDTDPCPRCGQDAVRQVSRANLRFGPGFPGNDMKRKPKVPVADRPTGLYDK